jgi:hypothetical protein
MRSRGRHDGHDAVTAKPAPLFPRSSSHGRHPADEEGTMKTLILCTLAALALPVSVRAQTVAQTPENYDSWPRLRSEFPSTGGGDIVIKGYDPVIVGGKCVTDFSAHTPDGKAHYNVVEFEIVAVAGGTLCTNGK